MFDLLEAIKEQKDPAVQEEKKGKIIDLVPFLERCCSGLDTRQEEVKKRLLNQGNIEDIISGDIPAKCIRAHIELWIVEGKQKIN